MADLPYATSMTTMTKCVLWHRFASYFLAMSPVFYDTLSGIPGINPADAINPSFGKFVPYEICIGKSYHLQSWHLLTDKWVWQSA